MHISLYIHIDIDVCTYTRATTELKAVGVAKLNQAAVEMPNAKYAGALVSIIYVYIYIYI